VSAPSPPYEMRLRYGSSTLPSAHPAIRVLCRWADGVAGAVAATASLKEFTLCLPLSLALTVSPSLSRSHCVSLSLSLSLCLPLSLSPSLCLPLCLHQACAQEAVQTVLDGVNCTIMAYGQTGAGKTYTMTGGKSNFQQVPKPLTGSRAARRCAHAVECDACGCLAVKARSLTAETHRFSCNSSLCPRS
jgi:hypothetical protein